jgi:hypothetical protein
MKDPVYNTGEKMEPVDFSKGINSLIFERSDNISSCAYFYLDKPEPSFQK